MEEGPRLLALPGQIPFLCLCSQKQSWELGVPWLAEQRIGLEGDRPGSATPTEFTVRGLASSWQP